MGRYLHISCCKSECCPYFNYFYLTSHDYCNKECRDIKETDIRDGFPVWCPLLEDAYTTKTWDETFTDGLGTEVG